jgi:hypothetical protein
MMTNKMFGGAEEELLEPPELHEPSRRAAMRAEQQVSSLNI